MKIGPAKQAAINSSGANIRVAKKPNILAPRRDTSVHPAATVSEPMEGMGQYLDDVIIPNLEPAPAGRPTTFGGVSIE
ncbi:MAG: hypothetical protein AAGD25_06395 [Cyanobacteria bacterium P01_F01_bin.150]